MNACDIAWAAGIFEGEGCVTASISGRKRDTIYPQMSVTSTDPDVLRKYHEIVGFGNVQECGRNTIPEHYKTKWQWRANGWRNTRALWELFLPYLGERRRNRFAEILSQETPKLRKSIDDTHCVNGHELVVPNLITYKGYGRCRSCVNERARRKRSARGI